MKAEHTNIVELLQPKPVHVVAPEVLDSLQTQFHRLIQKLAAQEVCMAVYWVCDLPAD